MNKAWILFVLVLVAAGQFMALSLFHQVNFNGPAPPIVYTSSGPSFSAPSENSVVTIAKWDYVDVRLQVVVLPVSGYGNTTVTLTLPNGTSVNITSSEGAYSFRLDLSRTGPLLSFLGESVSGPFSISEEQPVNVSIVYPSLADLNGTVTSLQDTANGIPGAQVFILKIVGPAEVSVFGYGVSL